MHFFLPELNVTRLSTFSKYTFPLKTRLLSASCHEHSLMLAVYIVCQISLWAIHVTLRVCLCSHPLQAMSSPMAGWLLQMMSFTLEFSSALSEGMCVCEWMHDIRNKWMIREVKWTISRHRSLVWYMDFVSKVCPAWIPALRFLTVLNHALWAFTTEVKVAQVLFNSLWPHGLESKEFSRPENWSGYPFPSPGDLPNPGMEPRSRVLQANSLLAEPQGKPKYTGVGSLSLLQQIFLTQELNWGLLYCRKILYQLSYYGSVLFSLRFIVIVLKPIGEGVLNHVVKYTRQTSQHQYKIRYIKIRDRGTWSLLELQSNFLNFT